MDREQAREAARADGFAEFRTWQGVDEVIAPAWGVGFDAAWDAALEYANRWTYCDDALPTEAGWYLISNEYGFVVRCEFDPRDGFYHYPKVIAWRPLPKAADLRGEK